MPAAPVGQDSLTHGTGRDPQEGATQQWKAARRLVLSRAPGPGQGGWELRGRDLCSGSGSWSLFLVSGLLAGSGTGKADAGVVQTFVTGSPAFSAGLAPGASAPRTQTWFNIVPRAARIARKSSVAHNLWGLSAPACHSTGTGRPGASGEFRNLGPLFSHLQSGTPLPAFGAEGKGNVAVCADWAGWPSPSSWPEHSGLGELRGTAACWLGLWLQVRGTWGGGVLALSPAVRGGSSLTC